MTDVTYANLSTLIGELKRAAIDAYMKSEGWDVGGDDDGLYSYQYGEDPDQVSRPGKNGEGGGDWHSNRLKEFFFNGSRDEEYRTAFDNVRSAIDNYISKWLWIPDPKNISPEVEAMRQANRYLAVTSSSSGGATTGSGAISGNLNGIDHNSTAMAGETISAFKSKFLLQLGSTIGGHHGLTIILGGALAAQEKLWTEARRTVAETVHVATKALHAYATDASVDWELVLTVVGVAVQGVALFATGGASTVLSGAGIALSVLKETAASGDKKADQPSGQDYDGLMKAFGKSLDQLASSVKSEESKLQENLKTNLTNVQNDKSSYDLTKPAILDVSDDSQAKIIIINRSLVNEITDTFMPAIAGELGKAAQKAYEGYSSTAYSRDASIGVGQYGPMSEWFDLMWLLYELLSDLKWEVENGAKTLDLAIEDMGATDSAAEDALEKQHRRVQEGSGYDPWH